MSDSSPPPRSPLSALSDGSPLGYVVTALVGALITALGLGGPGAKGATPEALALTKAEILASLSDLKAEQAQAMAKYAATSGDLGRRVESLEEETKLGRELTRTRAASRFSKEDGEQLKAAWTAKDREQDLRSKDALAVQAARVRDQDERLRELERTR